MAARPDRPGSALRRRAEQRLKRKDATKRVPTTEVRRLVHELQVHQIELELQNEALRDARTELEIALERSTELFAFAPIGYAVLERGDTIREINHVGAALLGAERGKLVGRPLSAFVVPDHQPTLLALLRGARERAETMKGDVELGDERQTRLTAALTANGLPRGKAVLLALEDVTQRRANDERLTRAESALRRADQRKDEFLATLSHELRNPLTPIRSSLMFLTTRKAAKSPAQTKTAHEVITRQVEHLSRLVDDLLDVTRIARGKVELQCADLELRGLLRECARDLAADFARRGITLETRLGARDLWAHGDATRLAQVFANVIGNALKFTPLGGHVTVGARAAGGRAEITVRDDGDGIAPDYLPHVFEPFSQGPRHGDRNRDGIGLGLPMVKGLIELHQGTVHVSSAGRGRGTEVTFSLPMVDAPRRTKPRGPPLRKVRRARRILLIEDNADAADSLQALLQAVGHEVLVSRNGATGIRQARDFRPDVILCDIGLPDLDGYAVARALRAQPALGATYLVALSGYGREQDVAKAQKSGFDVHLTKPPDFAKLLALLETAGRRTRATSPEQH